MILNKINFYGEELSTPRPTPKAGGPPLVGCRRQLIQYIRSYPPYCRPFFHPQPEDAPCLGDSDLLMTYVSIIRHFFVNGCSSLTAWFWRRRHYILRNVGPITQLTEPLISEWWDVFDIQFAQLIKHCIFWRNFTECRFYLLVTRTVPWKSLVIRKVLRPVISPQCFLGFTVLTEILKRFLCLKLSPLLSMQPSIFKFVKFEVLAQGCMRRKRCELSKKNMRAGNGKGS